MLGVENSFKRVQEKMRNVNASMTDLTEGNVFTFFDSVHLKVNFTSAEASLMQIVSFFYIVLHEGTSKENYNFITDKLKAYKGNADLLRSFKKLIHSLRTVQQHNVDIEKSEDKQKIYSYEEWLFASTGKVDNLSVEDWKACCVDLISRFESVLDEIKNAMDMIKSLDKEFLEVVIEDWGSKINNTYPIWRFKTLCITVFKNFGFESLDTDKFCNQYYEQWLREFKQLKNFDFSDYATRMIERDFLSNYKEKNLPLPISGTDVISYFDIPPGPLVKEIMLSAQMIYSANPCTKIELLGKLKVPNT